MSLKEKFAAKKAQKAEKRAVRDIKRQTDTKAVRTAVNGLVNRNMLGKCRAAREHFLLVDEACMSESEVREQIATNDLHYNNLIYGRDLTRAYLYMEYAIGFLNLTAHFMESVGLSAEAMLYMANKADGELKQHNGTWGVDSPNQNRRKAAWLRDMLDIVHGLLPILSAKFIHWVAGYNTALIGSRYFKRLLSGDLGRVAVMLMITQGASLRDCAKRLNVKEPILREQMLLQAQLLYKMAERAEECEGIQPATSIPDLRGAPYQWVGKWHNLLDLANTLRYKLAHEFEQLFGLCLYDWLGYDRVVKMAVHRLNSVLKG